MLSKKKGITSKVRPVTKGFYNQWLNKPPEEAEVVFLSSNIGFEDPRWEDDSLFHYTDASRVIGFPLGRRT
jgi:hypothetical protein